MNNILSKVLKFFLGGLLLVAVLLAIVYFSAVGNLDPEATFAQQEVELGGLLNTYLIFAFVLAVVAAALTILFAVVKMVTDPKSAIKTFISIGVLLAVAFVGWSMASGKELIMPGYTGEGNVPDTLKISGMLLYTMYFSIVGIVLTVLYAEVSKIFR